MSTTRKTKAFQKTKTAPRVPGIHQGSQRNRKYGRCLLCSERLYSSDKYVTTEQGYCCQNCLEKIAGEK